MVVRVAGYGSSVLRWHSTTTTRSACCATYPVFVVASPSRPDDVGPMLRTVRRRGGRSTGASACSSSPIGAVPRTRSARGRRRRVACAARRVPCPVGLARSIAAGRDLTIVTWANACGCRCASRTGSPIRGSSSVSSTCAGLRRCRSRTSCGGGGRPAASSSATRRAGAVAVGGHRSRRSSTRVPKPDRAGHEQGLVRAARRRRKSRAAVRGRDRGGALRCSRRRPRYAACQPRGWRSSARGEQEWQRRAHRGLVETGRRAWRADDRASSPFAPHTGAANRAEAELPLVRPPRPSPASRTRADLPGGERGIGDRPRRIRVSFSRRQRDIADASITFPAEDACRRSGRRGASRPGGRKGGGGGSLGTKSTVIASPSPGIERVAVSPTDARDPSSFGRATSRRLSGETASPRRRTATP